MVCNEEACAECTKNCILVHRKKKDPSAVVTSFFKVMISAQFSNILFLPPKFARTVVSLVDKETYLEDSTGQRWRVTLSDVDGSLAFQKGWNDFLLDHDIQLGDFLIFHYIMGSHFVVQIYGKSGCEKLDFSMTVGKKKSRNDTYSVINDDGPLYTNDKGSNSKNVQGLIASDLSVSDFRKTKNNSNVWENGSVSAGNVSPLSRPAKNKRKVLLQNEKSPVHADIPPPRQTNRGLNDKEQVAEEVLTKAAPLAATNAELNGKNTNPKVMTSVLDTAQNDSCNEKCTENGEVDLTNSRQSLKTCQSPEKRITRSSKTIMGVKQDPVHMSQELTKPVDIIPELTAQTNEGKELGSTEGNEQGSVPSLNDKFLVNKESGEAIMPFNFSCSAVITSLSYLELPRRFPYPGTHRGRGQWDRKVVVLRDPEMRLWPVLYHESGGLKFFASGWEAFGKANNIQAGYECAFEVESETEGIYRVGIARM